jgi:hypothetical protein
MDMDTLIAPTRTPTPKLIPKTLRKERGEKISNAADKTTDATHKAIGA